MSKTTTETLESGSTITTKIFPWRIEYFVETEGDENRKMRVHFKAIKSIDGNVIGEENLFTLTKTLAELKEMSGIDGISFAPTEVYLTALSDKIRDDYEAELLAQEQALAEAQAAEESEE